MTSVAALLARPCFVRLNPNVERLLSNVQFDKTGDRNRCEADASI